MESNSPRRLSTTEIDLESVLQVRRRQVSVNHTSSSIESHRHADVIFLKVERSIDIIKEDARCVFHGLFSFSFHHHTNNCFIRKFIDEL